MERSPGSLGSGVDGGSQHRDRHSLGDSRVDAAFAKELVAFQPDFILTSSTPATAAMVQQTRTIPIIFVMVSNPVGNGDICRMLPAITILLN
jgi:ABC-type uncharacterized transport system substrate-binding protein